MPGARTLYFPEVGPVWEDWVQVTNVGSQSTKVLAISRHSATGDTVWSEARTIDPFECRTPNVEAVKESSSMQFHAD